MYVRKLVLVPILGGYEFCDYDIVLCDEQCYAV